MSNEGDFLPLYSVLARPRCQLLTKDINYLKRIQRAVIRWVKSLRSLIDEERLKDLKQKPLEKRSPKNYLVLNHNILYNQKDLEAIQLFKFSRRPGLRRSSIKLFYQAGRTPRSRNRFLPAGLFITVTVCHSQSHR